MHLTIRPEPAEGKLHLYDAVRAAFILRGTTFNKWCVDNHVCRQHATRVLRQNGGLRAQLLR